MKPLLCILIDDDSGLFSEYFQVQGMGEKGISTMKRRESMEFEGKGFILECIVSSCLYLSQDKRDVLINLAMT